MSKKLQYVKTDNILLAFVPHKLLGSNFFFF